MNGAAFAQHSVHLLLRCRRQLQQNRASFGNTMTFLVLT